MDESGLILRIGRLAVFLVLLLFWWQNLTPSGEKDWASDHITHTIRSWDFGEDTFMALIQAF